jgi:hypothetical protein
MAGRQRQQLKELRAEQQQLATQTEAAKQAVLEASQNLQPAARQTGPPIELLELRGEVTRLKGRVRELAAARGEHEQLRAQFAAGSTNSVAAPTLPPGYMLKSRAQWKGLNTPEDTLQSFLWAAQNRDLTNLLQTMTPRTASEVWEDAQRGGRSMDDFFKEAGALPGMRIVGRTQEGADLVVLQVEIIPGMGKPELMRLRLINGEWKMEMR